MSSIVFRQSDILQASADALPMVCRNTVGMTVGFLRSYSQLVIRTCHKREVHAMGGMAAQIPIKNNEDANNAAIEKASRCHCCFIVPAFLLSPFA